MTPQIFQKNCKMNSYSCALYLKTTFSIAAAAGSSNVSLNVSDISKRLNYIYVDGDQHSLKYSNVQTVEVSGLALLDKRGKCGGKVEDRVV